MSATPTDGIYASLIQGRTQPRRKQPTQRHVARMAGVSQDAVSRWTSARGYVAIEVRERILRSVEALSTAGVEITASVPFERLVESRRRWRPADQRLNHLECRSKPKSWSRRYRFIFIRKRVHRQNKPPFQLDFFVPREGGYDFKVVVTNKRLRAKKLVLFHEGCDSQEGVFAELKTHCQMGYVPVTTRLGNQLYMYSAILAHNITRALQMLAHPPGRATTVKRVALWTFQKLDTLRRNLIQHAGRLVRPNDHLVLSMNTNPTVEDDVLHCLDALRAA